MRPSWPILAACVTATGYPSSQRWMLARRESLQRLRPIMVSFIPALVPRVSFLSLGRRLSCQPASPRDPSGYCQIYYSSPLWSIYQLSVLEVHYFPRAACEATSGASFFSLFLSWWWFQPWIHDPAHPFASPQPSSPVSSRPVPSLPTLVHPSPCPYSSVHLASL